MQNLTTFLTRIQTFDLQVIPKKELFHYDASAGRRGPVNEADLTSPAYSLSHQTDHGSYTYKSELSLQKDMALLDIIALDAKRQELVAGHLQKIKERFNGFWKSFHEHHREWHADYAPDYLVKVNLFGTFIVNNYRVTQDVFIGEDFVESLNDSAKLRERLLTGLIQEAEKVRHPVQTFEDWKAKQKQDGTGAVSLQGSDLPSHEDPRPRFTAGSAEAFLNVVAPYFEDSDQSELRALLFSNAKPSNPLTFKGNGNQLADAFKQLYEANLIVGCRKTELEKWIALNFQYQYNNAAKSYTEGWLNGIISSDAKPCKSPILEIRSKDGQFTITPTLRSKKNNKY